MKPNRFVLALGLAVLFVPLFGHAQISPSGIGGESLSINLQPQYPEPNEEVTATIDDATLGVSGEIRWSLNGSAISEATNQRSLTFTAGALGEDTTIRAEVSPPNTPPVVARRTVTPAIVDIILEPQTYAPSFYAGRPLPSVHSQMRATAITHTGSGGDTYSYTWRLNNQVIGGGTQQNNTSTFTVPRAREMILSVEAMRDGKTVARQVLSVPVAEPELLFYERNPLKGLRPFPFVKNIALTDTEVIVEAVPFHLDRRVLSGNTLFEWKLNGRDVSSGGTNPRVTTLERTALGSGASRLQLHIRNLDDVLQGVEDSIEVRY